MSASGTFHHHHHRSFLLRPGFHLACVIAKKLVSPTVCEIQLHVPTLSAFAPGSWIDFIPASSNPTHASQSWVGGFSLVSLSSDLPICTLAIKRSHHPASKHVHNVLQCSDVVHIRVGEETCVWKSPSSLNHDPTSIICIAGGIGITHILPIYQSALLYYRNKNNRNTYHVASTSTNHVTTTDPHPLPAKNPPIHLFYSVSCQKEWVYGDKLLELYRRYGNRDMDRIWFTLTQRQNEWHQPQCQNGANTNGITYMCGGGRQAFHSFLEQHVNSSRGEYYVCGPTGMIDDTVRILKDQGVPDTQLHYEKWW